MNQNFQIKDNLLTLKINKQIYPKEVIIQTTYVMLENYYFLIDKDDKYYIVYIKLKNKANNENKQGLHINPNKALLEKAAYEFFDELIESQSYLDQLKRTAKTREIILEKALLPQTINKKTLEKARKQQQK